MSTPKKLTEVEAVSVVHQALEPFDVPGRSRVLRAVISLLDVEPLSPKTGEPSAKNPAMSSGVGCDLNNTRIDTFVSAKKPVNTYQRLACLAFYLEHHDQLTELSAKDLTKANAAARQPKMSNITVFLDDATRKYGFFAAVGAGKKSLTTRGSSVVGALPDQEAVKQVFEEFPLPRQSGKRTKKNK